MPQIKFDIANMAIERDIRKLIADQIDITDIVYDTTKKELTIDYELKVIE